MRLAAIAAIALSCVSTSVLAQSPLDLRNAAFAKDGDALNLAPKLGDPAGFGGRQWNALKFESKALELDVSPHAGFAVSERGSRAQAGATVSLHPRTDKTIERLKDMGVREGSAFGDVGRWYLFAAASGQAVGMNMLRSDGGWDRAGWSTDPTGALVGDAQVGVGWRKGDLQSSFGVVHREVKGRHMVFGQMTRDDTMAAFTFSLRPQR